MCDVFSGGRFTLINVVFMFDSVFVLEVNWLWYIYIYVLVLYTRRH